MKLFLWVWLATAVAAFGETQFAFTNFAGLPGASGTADGTNSGARFAGPFSTGRENTGDFGSRGWVRESRRDSPAG